MKWIKDYKDGDRVFDIYLCKHKQSAVTKNGKSYENVILQDRTGTVDAKIWDPNSAGIEEFSALDYIEVYGEMTSFNGALQVNIKRVRLCREGEYNPADYLPVSSKNIDRMYGELLEEPETPSREGYVFTGWYTDSGCSDMWDMESGTIQSDMTLYAGWQKLQ